MARSETENTEWETHRNELKALYERLTVDQVREYMSEKYNFTKNNDQYVRQFKKWAFRKNRTGEDWRYIAHRREKRKREGKDPGPVRIDGNLIPEPKVRRAIARHVLPTAQYLDTVNGEAGPPTPKGIVVGTPKPGVQGTESPSLQLGWLPDLSEPFIMPDLSATSINPTAADIHYASPIHISEVSNEILDYGGMIPEAHMHLDSASNATPIRPSTTGHCSLERFKKEILEGVSTLFKGGVRDLNDLSESLAPVTIESVHNDLIRKATGIFQPDSLKDISHYLSLCVYLSSNNLLSQLAMDKLATLLSKTKFSLILGTLWQSPSTTTEIFMSKLLASAAALGEVEFLRALVHQGVDLDATGGNLKRETPLSLAIRRKNIECVRLLLEAGADPNIRGAGETPLQIACVTCEGSTKMVELLLKSGAQVNPPQNFEHLTALQLAVKHSQKDIIRLLLQWKADPNSFTTSTHGTALQIACRSSSDAEIPEILIKYGADVDTHADHNSASTNLNIDSSDSDFDIVLDDLHDGYIDKFKPPILIAADNQNWDTVQVLLEEGAAINPSMRGFPGEYLESEFRVCNNLNIPAVLTALQAAVRAENITMTRMLLSAGAQVDARPKGKYGHTALQIAAMMDNQRILRILLLKGADINAAASVLEGGLTVVQAAAHHLDTELLSFVISEGADVNAPASTTDGKSALQAAIALRNIDAVRILLDAGASVTDGGCKEGLLAMQKAIQITDLKVRNGMISLLLHAGVPFEPPRGLERFGSLHTAVYIGDIDITKKILNRGTNVNIGYFGPFNHTPLQSASWKGNEALVRLLINSGADVNAPAHHFRGHTALQAAAFLGHSKVVEVLLNSGVDIRAAASFKGLTAIDSAIFNCDEEMVRIFLDANPELISWDPSTKQQALSNALYNFECTLSFIKFLIQHGAEVDTSTAPSSLKPCLQRAVERGGFEIVQYLVNAGADVNRRWSAITNDFNPTALQAAVARRNIDIVRLLIERGADASAPANPVNGGQTALQIAVSMNYFEMVQLLVQSGADINGAPSPKGGRTALQEAASSGDLKLAQYLLQNNADVNAPAAPFRGITALQGASISGNIRIVMMLLAAGADINAPPALENGRTAIEGAAENGRLNTLHVLLDLHPHTEDFEIKRRRAAKLTLANGHLAIGRFLMAYRKSAWKG